MLKRILNISCALVLTIASSSGFAQGPACIEMQPICTDVGISFIAGDEGEAEPGNDYGCLGSWPSPSWYFLEIAVGGDIEMELFAGSDIDFIIWGPFDDLADAISNCGTLGGVDSPIVDCSYSAVAYETPEITGCVAGEVYILLITNFSGVIQEVTCGKLGGDAETDCDIIDIPPCISDPGTFTIQKNGEFVPSDDPIFLCEGDSYEITSNDDYTLPTDTIAAPIGDGIYTAQLMWLVYDAPPVGDDPLSDPGYLDLIIPTEDIMDLHDDDSPIGELGCGTYYLVPVAGDDGVGDGADNDNFSVTWDKDGNGCYELGDPIVVTYACPIEAEIQVNCDGEYINGIDLILTGGGGDFTLVSTGSGDLVDGDVVSGGTATIENLEGGWTYEIEVTDEAGCTATFSGIFSAPVISPVIITPAVSCPDASLGNVEANIIDGTGNGAPYVILLNGTPTPGTTADIDDIAGTAVTIIAVDSEGCISDSVVTITSAGHFIDIDVITLVNVSCFGFDNGSAEITATPVDALGDVDGTILTITWTDPLGGTYPGDGTNTSQSEMIPGTWFVTIVDDYGCEVTIPIEITSPAELDLTVNTLNQPTCYAYSDGSIDLAVTGGTGVYAFSWRDLPGEDSDVLNTIGSGTYWGYVTDENGCIDSIQVIVDEPDSLYAEFTIKNVLCYGESTGQIIVDEVFNSSGTVRYFWDLGGVVPNPATDVSFATGLPAGTYLVTIQDEYCDNLYEFTITENDQITFSELGFDPAYCRIFGYQSGNGQVFAAATGGIADYEYLWTKGGTPDNSINSTWGGLNPGDYKVRVTDAVGCIVDTTITVDSLNPEAIFTITSDQLNEDCNGTETVFANFSNQSINFANPLNPGADTTFWWNFDYDNTNWILSEDLDEQFDTTYTGEEVYTVCLVASNKNGCKDTTCKDITVFAEPDFVPFNVFTPDGDGLNDVFSFNKEAKGVDVFECVIVDRWGSVVYEFTSITDGWNGERKSGSPSAAGVYFYTYVIRYTNGTEQQGQGNVTLLRK